MNMNARRKSLAVTVILLFIGVSIAPSINFNVVKASNDNDLVEVTTQACGIKGFGNTTVKLTRQQYQNLEQYLVDFRARLNQTTTREEAVPLFKEAVVELNKYGLLPKGMNVEQAQRLVMGRYQKTGLYHRLEKPSFVNRINDSNNSNYLCLVCSVTDNTVSVGPLVRWINNYWYLISETNYSIKLPPVLFYILLNLLAAPMMFGWLLTTFNPFKVLYTLTYGGEGFNSMENHYEYYPSNGWVATFGSNGIKIFQKPLWGHLPLFPICLLCGLGGYSYPGIFGYMGLWIPLRKGIFYLGSALWVEIGSEHPELPH